MFCGGPNCCIVSIIKATESRNEFIPTRNFFASVALNCTINDEPERKIKIFIEFQYLKISDAKNFDGI